MSLSRLLESTDVIVHTVGAHRSGGVGYMTYSDFRLVKFRLTQDFITHNKYGDASCVRYATIFNDDFTKFRKVDGCYLSPYPYTNHLDPVVAVTDDQLIDDLAKTRKLVHCVTDLKYFDVHDPELTSIKYSRWFAQTIHLIRQMYPDLPAKKYHTLTVHAVAFHRDGDIVDGYPIEQLIILPDGIVRLYLGPEDNYMFKDNETEFYDLTKNPYYRGEHRITLPRRWPVRHYVEYNSILAIDYDGVGHAPKSAGERAHTSIPDKLYQRDHDTSPITFMSGCSVS